MKNKPNKGGGEAVAPAITPQTTEGPVTNSPSTKANIDGQPPLDSQLVDGSTLLELLWHPKSRPTLRWLREQTALGSVPHVRLGRLIFYRPKVVMNNLGGGL